MFKIISNLCITIIYQIYLCLGIVALIVNLFGCKAKASNTSKNQALFYLPDIHDKYPQIFTIDSLIFYKKSEGFNIDLSTNEDFTNEINNYILGKELTTMEDKKIQNAIYEKIMCDVAAININTKTDVLNYELAVNRHVSFLNDLKSSLKNEKLSDYYKGQIAFLLARYHDERKNNLDSAWHYIMTSRAAFEKTGIITPAYQECLEKITAYCTYKRKNLLAIRYANAMFDFDRYLPSADNVDTARAYANRAFMMFREGDFEGTDKDIDNGLSLIDPEKNPIIFQNLMKSRLVTSMIKKDDSIWHTTAVKILSNIQKTGKDHIEINRWIGQYYTQSGQYKKAIPNLKTALVAEISKGYLHSARYSTLCFLLSQCCEELGDYSKALHYMAKNIGLDDYDEKKMIQHILINEDYSFVTALRCANIYFTQYKRTNKQSSLLKAKMYLDALERVMFGQFKVMEENAILQFYLESGQEYFHLGMDTHYELWKKTGEQQYLKSFIQYSDKNKNSLMYRDIQMASNLSALSEEMIQKEFELRAVIKGEKRKGMRSNKAFNRYMDEYTRLENKISTLNRSFISHGLQKEPINIKTFQQTMDEEMSILIIDETQEYWYYTLISRNKIILDRQKITPDKMRSIDSLLASIQKEQKVQNMNADLLPNIILASLTKKMMYIPDGAYHRFPLSALLDNNNNDIKYLPTMSLYKKLATTPQMPKASAFFAFSDPGTIKSKHRTRLTELPGTFKEVTRLCGQYNNSMIYSGKNATKSNFIKAYQDTNIQYIHLALHGLANSGKKDDVKLFFRTSTGGLDSLYGYELLKYKSKCHKIVLSACQSGLGTYEKGEGLFSLPRYFMINGATDVVFNYWDVDD